MVRVIDVVRRRYPWDEWTDGQARLAERGVDFDCKPESFRAVLYAYAGRNNIAHEISVRGQTVRFRLAKRRRKKKSA